MLQHIEFFKFICGKDSTVLQTYEQKKWEEHIYSFIYFICTKNMNLSCRNIMRCTHYDQGEVHAWSNHQCGAYELHVWADDSHSRILFSSSFLLLFSLYLNTLFVGLQILVVFNLILIYWAGFYIFYDLHIL